METTLLSPAESAAFSSFLSSMEDSQPPADWATYAAQFSSTANTRDDDDMLLQSVPSPPENDPLTKATMDLMSLDSGGWMEAGGNVGHQQQHQHQQPPPSIYGLNGHLQQQHVPMHHNMSQSPVQLPSFSSLSDPFPFLNSKQQQSFDRQQSQGFLQQPQPRFVLPGQQHPQSLLSIPHGNIQSPSNDLYAFPQSQSRPSLQIPHSHSQSSKPTAPSIGSGPSKRPLRLSTALSSSSSSSTTPTGSGPSAASGGKRASTSYTRNSISRPSHPNGSAQSSKPALLSPSQKKANHIQSEQKRRANIRRGYEALCEIVPALRDAIREEEEEARAAAVAAAAGLTNSKSKSSSKKRLAVKKKDGEEGARDKIDGRAGPRSENVVLSKTIEYINELLSEKAALLVRLQRARSMLPPGHPVLTPLSPNPAWEREWKGGEGKMEDGDGDEGEDSDDMDDNEDGNAGNSNSTIVQQNESSGRVSGKKNDKQQ